MTNKMIEVNSQEPREPHVANRRRSRAHSFLLAGVLLITCHLPLATALAGTHVTATYNLGANPIVVATVNGTPEYGLVFVQRNEPITYNSIEYGKTVLEGYLNASGQLNDGAGNLYVNIVPNSTATPSGSYYVATFNIQGHVHAEIWIVPDQTTVDADLIRQTELSDPSAGPAFFYQSIQNSGTSLAQRPVLNFTGTGVTCADNAGAGRTDCTITAGSGVGSGSVTSFSSGNLTPLFTTSVATATTTPALSFSLSSAAAHTFLGNNTASSAPPAYVQPGFADLIGTAADAQLAGAYSGTGTCASHQWVNSLVRNGGPVCAEPAAADISGLAPSATIDTTNAANISSGTLPAAQVPNPTATTLGGIESLAAAPHKWISSISTAGAPNATQPDYSDLTGTPQLANTLAQATHNWLDSYNAATGNFTQSQPAFSDISGTAAASQIPNPSGDLTGTYSAAKVSGLHFGSTGMSLSSTAPSSGQCIGKTGSSIGGVPCSAAPTAYTSLADVPPSSPTAYDDEFNGSSINTSQWTESCTVTEKCTFTEANRVLSIYNTWGGSQTGAYLFEGIPPCPWTMVVKLSYPGTQVTYAGAGIKILESSTAKNYSILVGEDGGSGFGIYRYINSGAVTSAGIGNAGDWIYLKVVDDCTSLYSTFSRSGITYAPFVNVGAAGNKDALSGIFATAPNQIGISLDDNNSVDQAVDVDYVRFCTTSGCTVP